MILTTNQIITAFYKYQRCSASDGSIDVYAFYKYQRGKSFSLIRRQLFFFYFVFNVTSLESHLKSL